MNKCTVCGIQTTRLLCEDCVKKCYQPKPTQEYCECKEPKIRKYHSFGNTIDECEQCGKDIIKPLKKVRIEELKSNRYTENIKEAKDIYDMLKIYALRDINIENKINELIRAYNKEPQCPTH